MEGIAAKFTWWDWGALFGYLAFTTWIGHHFAGKQATIKDFFLAGRRLPWQAVSGSIIATAISGVTFVGVPSIVFAAEGNFFFLQASIGSIIARLIIAKWFIPAFYEKEIYSPYDFMANRLGGGVGKLTTCLFFLGAILGQSARVFLTAIVLEVITGWPIALSVAVIGLFAIVWTWMGGIATVIWTDVVQFFLFVIGGLLALGFILAYLPLSVDQAFKVAADYGKMDTLNLTTDPRVSFTLWAAIIAWPFQNLASYGTDQLNAQRFFTCKTPGDASKAIVFSCFSELITLLMLTVGAMLFAYYQLNPMDPIAAAAVAEKGDRVFPIFIVQELPPGITGLLIAGIFAAAISSLDSILAALTQTTMTTFYQPYFAKDKSDAYYVMASRVMVLLWGILLSGVAYWFATLPEDIAIVPLVFALTAYTFGPMLGIFLLALLAPHCGARGLWIGVPLSVILASFVRNALHARYEEGWPAEFFVIWQPTAERIAELNLSGALAYIWLIPLTTAITLGCGLLFGRRKQA